MSLKDKIIVELLGFCVVNIVINVFNETRDQRLGTLLGTSLVAGAGIVYSVYKDLKA